MLFPGIYWEPGSNSLIRSEMFWTFCLSDIAVSLVERLSWQAFTLLFGAVKRVKSTWVYHIVGYQLLIRLETLHWL